MKRPVPCSRPSMQSYIMTCPCVSFKERTFLKLGVWAEGKLVLRPQCSTAGDISRRAMLLLAAHCTQRLDPGDSSSSLARRGGGGGGGGYEGRKAVMAAKGNLRHRCSGPHRSMRETVLCSRLRYHRHLTMGHYCSCNVCCYLSVQHCTSKDSVEHQ